MEESRKALFFLLFLGVIDVIRYFAASRDVTNLIEYMHEEQAYKKTAAKDFISFTLAESLQI